MWRRRLTRGTAVESRRSVRVIKALFSSPAGHWPRQPVLSLLLRFSRDPGAPSSHDHSLCRAFSAAREVWRRRYPARSLVRRPRMAARSALDPRAGCRARLLVCGWIRITTPCVHVLLLASDLANRERRGAAYSARVRRNRTLGGAPRSSREGCDACRMSLTPFAVVLACFVATTAADWTVRCEGANMSDTS